MAQPQINISFKTTADTTIGSVGSGVVGIILHDSTKDDTTYKFTTYNDVVKSNWSSANLDFLEKTFMGNPKIIIVERVATVDPDYETALKRLKQKKINYLAIPGLPDEDKTTIVPLLKALRSENVTIKSILGNVASDNEGIINFATDDIKVGSKTYTAQQYSCRIAGLLAGLALDVSATYNKLSEIDSITESLDPNGDEEAGKLILLNDGESIKLGRAVTSLTTIQGEKSEAMKKIKIVNGMDMMRDDIVKAFETQYIGLNNTYDNKCVFMNAIREYFKKLVRLGVLDDTFEHSVSIDVNAVRDMLGSSVSELTDDEVKRQNTGSSIFITANIKFCDAIEDLKFNIYM